MQECVRVGERTRRRMRKSGGHGGEERERKQYKCREIVNAPRYKETRENLWKIDDAKMKSTVVYIPLCSIINEHSFSFSRVNFFHDRRDLLIAVH